MDVDIVVVFALTAHGGEMKAAGFTDSDRLDGARGGTGNCLLASAPRRKVSPPSGSRHKGLDGGEESGSR